ncbi:hypothetical protein P4S68_15540 [Pseudoalteromonas sp. Hal099]
MTNTTKLGNAFAHHGSVQGRIAVNDKVDATIDDARRERIEEKSHSYAYFTRSSAPIIR